MSTTLDRIANALERIAKVMEADHDKPLVGSSSVLAQLVKEAPLADVPATELRLDDEIPAAAIPENPKVDVGYAHPHEIAKAEEQEQARAKALEETPPAPTKEELEAVRRAAELVKALVAAGLDEDLAARVADLGDDTQDPQIAAGVRICARARLGFDGFEVARERAGIRKGICPTGAELRRFVLEHVAKGSPAPATSEVDPWK